MAKTIYEKIADKALKDAEEIIRLGREKAQKIEEEIISEAEATIRKNLERARLQGEEYVKTKTTELEQKAKQEILQAKKDLISSVFLSALDELNALSDEKLGELVKKLILSEKLKGNELILVNARDRERYIRLFSEGRKDGEAIILDKLNRSLGKDFNLRLGSEPAKISGGFLIVGDTFDVDMSFETLLRGLEEKHETAIAEILFARGE
ncbi:MAG TPA: hypothetical protein GYA05_01250 [Acholeplasmataceae bacterium]|nr:hypothetical protein [Acholeplasmataceae bacterium]